MVWSFIKFGAVFGVWGASGACSPTGGTLARLCPDGCFQDQTLVFSCAGVTSGESSAQLEANGLNLAGLGAPGAQLAQVELPAAGIFNISMLPAGLVGFSVTISAYDPDGHDSALRLLLFDPLSGSYTVKYDDGDVNETSPSGTGLNGVDVLYTFDGNEQISLIGGTDRPLMLQAENGHPAAQTVMLAYTFASLGAPTCAEGTTQPPVGCRPYKKFTARAAVVSFSYWVQTVHGTDADAAWNALVPASCRAGTEVPYYRWSEVWRQWPLCAADAVPGDTCRPEEVDWEETFRYVTMNSPGWVVTKGDFTMAFNLANVAIQTSLCFSYLRGGLTEAAAVAMLHDPASFRTEIGATCNVTDPAQANATFNFVDADGDGTVSSDELRKSWGFDKQCPHNTVRNQTVIFKSYPVKSFSKVELRPAEQTVFAKVPAGVQDLWVNISCQSDCDLLLYDTAAHEWILHWDADTGYINRRHPTGNYPNASLHPEATPAFFCYVGEREETQRQAMESIMIIDHPTPTLFDIRLMNSAAVTNEVTVSYEYSQWGPSSEAAMPYGCESFDILRGRTACMSFSSWLADQTRPNPYLTSDDAFSQLTAEGSGGNVGHPSYAITVDDVTYIPFHFFEQVWSSWPQSTQVPNWQDCFGYADEDHSDYIDQSEFGVIYSLATTYVSVTQYCAFVRVQHDGAYAAWLNVSGAYKSVPFEVWTAHWDAFNVSTTAAWTATSGDKSFHFLDFNDDLVISHDEYVEGCYAASMCPTSTRPPFGAFELIGDSDVYTQMQGFEQGTANAEHEAARRQCEYDTATTTTTSATPVLTTPPLARNASSMNVTAAPSQVTSQVTSPVAAPAVHPNTTSTYGPCAEHHHWYQVDIGVVDFDPCTYTTSHPATQTVPLATTVATTRLITLPPTTTTTVHPYTPDRIAVDGSLEMVFGDDYAATDLEASLDNVPAMRAIASALASTLSTAPGITVDAANVTLTGVNPAATARRMEGFFRHLPRRMTGGTVMDIAYEVATWPDWDPTNLMNSMRQMNDGTSALSESFAGFLGQNLAAVDANDPVLTNMANQINTGQMHLNPPVPGTDTVRTRSVHGDLDRNGEGGLRNWAEEEEPGFSGWWLLIIPLILLCCAFAALLILRRRPKKLKAKRGLQPHPEEDEYAPVPVASREEAPLMQLAPPVPMLTAPMQSYEQTNPFLSHPPVRMQAPNLLQMTPRTTQPAFTNPMMTGSMMTNPMATSPMMTNPMATSPMMSSLLSRNSPSTLMLQPQLR